MPRKKTVLTDEERAKRIRETAEEIGASADPKALGKALKQLLHPKQPAKATQEG